MTKLEAWKKWCEEARVTDATEYTLEMSSHGKAFSAGWDAAVEECAKVCDGWAKYGIPAVAACASEIRARGEE